MLDPRCSGTKSPDSLLVGVSHERCAGDPSPGYGTKYPVQGESTGTLVGTQFCSWIRYRYSHSTLSFQGTWSSSILFVFVTATYTESSHLPPAIRLASRTVRRPDFAHHVSCLITHINITIYVLSGTYTSQTQNFLPTPISSSMPLIMSHCLSSRSSDSAHQNCTC
jgi:hypothetical protein